MQTYQGVQELVIINLLLQREQTHFFPNPNDDSRPANRSPWSIFWMNPGYWEYHYLMMNCTPSEALEVTNQLEKIFSLVQTLTESVKGS
jgi:hypothetical protein